MTCSGKQTIDQQEKLMTASPRCMKGFFLDLATDFLLEELENGCVPKCEQAIPPPVWEALLVKYLEIMRSEYKITIANKMDEKFVEFLKENKASFFELKIVYWRFSPLNKEGRSYIVNPEKLTEIEMKDSCGSIENWPFRSKTLKRIFLGWWVLPPLIDCDETWLYCPNLETLELELNDGSFNNFKLFCSKFSNSFGKLKNLSFVKGTYVRDEIAPIDLLVDFPFMKNLRSLDFRNTELYPRDLFNITKLNNLVKLNLSVAKGTVRKNLGFDVMPSKILILIEKNLTELKWLDISGRTLEVASKFPKFESWMDRPLNFFGLYDCGLTKWHDCNSSEYHRDCDLKICYHEWEECREKVPAIEVACNFTEKQLLTAISVNLNNSALLKKILRDVNERNQFFDLSGLFDLLVKIINTSYEHIDEGVFVSIMELFDRYVDRVIDRKTIVMGLMWIGALDVCVCFAIMNFLPRWIKDPRIGHFVFKGLNDYYYQYDTFIMELKPSFLLDGIESLMKTSSEQNLLSDWGIVELFRKTMKFPENKWDKEKIRKTFLELDISV